MRAAERPTRNSNPTRAPKASTPRSTRRANRPSARLPAASWAVPGATTVRASRETARRRWRRAGGTGAGVDGDAPVGAAALGSATVGAAAVDDPGTVSARHDRPVSSPPPHVPVRAGLTRVSRSWEPVPRRLGDNGGHVAFGGPGPPHPRGYGRPPGDARLGQGRRRCRGRVSSNPAAGATGPVGRRAGRRARAGAVPAPAPATGRQGQHGLRRAGSSATSGEGASTRGSGATRPAAAPAPLGRRIVLVLVALWVTFLVVTPLHAWSQVSRVDTQTRPARGPPEAWEHLPPRGLGQPGGAERRGPGTLGTGARRGAAPTRSSWSTPRRVGQARAHLRPTGQLLGDPRRGPQQGQRGLRDRGARPCSWRRWRPRPASPSTGTSRSGSAGSRTWSTAWAEWGVPSQGDRRREGPHRPARGLPDPRRRELPGLRACRGTPTPGGPGSGGAPAPVPRSGHAAGGDPVDRPPADPLVGFTHAAAEGSSSGRTRPWSTPPASCRRCARCPRTSPQPGRPGGVHHASTSAGSAVLWDEERAEALFTMLREGTPLEAPREGAPTGAPRAGGRPRGDPAPWRGPRTRVPPLDSAPERRPGEQNLGTTTAEERGVAGEARRGGRDERESGIPGGRPRLGSRRLVHGRPAGAGGRRGAVALLVTVVVLTGAVAGGAVWHLNGNITKVDVSAAVGLDRPVAPPTEAVNILLIGSDTREGARQRHVRHGCARSPGTTPTPTSCPPVGGPDVGDRRLDPARLDDPAPPDCSPTAPKAEWVEPPVEQELPDRWYRVPHPDPRGQHRGVRRPLRGRGLPRVQDHGRRAGRGDGLHAEPIDDRKSHLGLAAGRHVSSTASRPSRTCAPASRWATARTSVASGDSRPSSPP